jgi:tetratricopeptide (TPR) repeat protein
LRLHDQLGRHRSAGRSADVGRAALPRPASLRLRLARLLRRAGRTADALRAYRQLADEFTGDAALQVEAAELTAEVGDATATRRYVDRALAIEPAHAEAIALLAGQLMTAGHFDAAGRFWWRRWRTDRRDRRALAGLLVCAAIEGRDRLADRAQRHLAETDRAGQAGRLIAEQWRAAMPGRLLRQSLQLRDADDDSIVGGMLAEAADVFSRAIDEQPHFADLHYHLAVCRRATGRSDQARRWLDGALSINPGYLDAARLQARLLIEAGQLAAAADLLHNVARRRPATHRLLDLRMVIDILQGGEAEAIDRLISSGLGRDERSEVLAGAIAQLDGLGRDQHADRWRALAARRFALPTPAYPAAA